MRIVTDLSQQQSNLDMVHLLAVLGWRSAMCWVTQGVDHQPHGRSDHRAGRQIENHWEPVAGRWLQGWLADRRQWLDPWRSSLVRHRCCSFQVHPNLKKLLRLKMPTRTMQKKLQIQTVSYKNLKGRQDFVDILQSK